MKGWIHVHSHTDPPERLLDYGEWTLRVGSGERKAHRVIEGRPHGDRLVARLAQIDDRDAAAALTGAWVEVERSRLPPPGRREHYQADLIGLDVQNLEGVALGTVAHFVDAPGGAVMVVKEPSGREHWVLATREYLRKVDIAAGSILVDWPVELE